jgi:hypothetical protein
MMTESAESQELIQRIELQVKRRGWEMLEERLDRIEERLRQLADRIPLFREAACPECSTGVTALVYPNDKKFIGVCPSCFNRIPLGEKNPPGVPGQLKRFKKLLGQGNVDELIETLSMEPKEFEASMKKKGSRGTKRRK